MNELPPMTAVGQETNEPIVKRKKRVSIIKKKPRKGRAVGILSIVYLVITMLVWYLISSFSEEWWLSTALTYLPRLPWLLPAVVLLVCSVVIHRKSIAINVGSLVIVLWLIMEFNIPTHSAVASLRENELIVISCNVQEYKPNFQKVLNEFVRLDPDIIAFQEARTLHPAFLAQYPDWHTVMVEQFVVCSRYPLKKIATCESVAFDRATAVAVEVETPQGSIMLFDMHLMTARKGLNELSIGGIFNGKGTSSVERFQRERDQEARATRLFVSDYSTDLPVVMMGDFNMPSSSSLYEKNWDGFTNAFVTTSWGYGYTSPCKAHRLWMENSPWLRIDHILTSRHWHVQSCQIGTSAGSDHRLIAAKLLLKN